MLEHHHAAYTCALLLNNAHAIFDHLPRCAARAARRPPYILYLYLYLYLYSTAGPASPTDACRRDVFMKVRSTIISGILATDMARHFEMIDRLMSLSSLDSVTQKDPAKFLTELIVRGRLGAAAPPSPASCAH